MDLRVQKTYFALHNAFMELLEEKHFDELTVNELCERAMIRRTTFYKHFADKYEYFSFFIQEMASTFHDQLAPDVLDGDSNAYFLHMSRELLRFMRMHDRMVRNIKQSSMFPTLMSILLDHITEDAFSVLLPSSEDAAPDAEQLRGKAAYFAGGMLNTLFRFMRENESVDEEKFIGIIESSLNSPK